MKLYSNKFSSYVNMLRGSHVNLYLTECIISTILYRYKMYHSHFPEIIHFSYIFNFDQIYI